MLEGVGNKLIVASGVCLGGAVIVVTSYLISQDNVCAIWQNKIDLLDCDKQVKDLALNSASSFYQLLGTGVVVKIAESYFGVQRVQDVLGHVQI